MGNEKDRPYRFQIEFYRWPSEGFATFFGEKVCQIVGKPYIATHHLNAHDSAEVNKFHTNMIFGINTVEQHIEDDAREYPVMIAHVDAYSFGSLFFRYLEAKYGTGFYKRISNTFYTDMYKGFESRFHDRTTQYQYQADAIISLIRKALTDDVYTSYPSYAYNQLSEMVENEAIVPLHEEDSHTHSLLKIDRMEATCRETGTEEYWKCSECGRLFSDPEGMTEIAMPLTIPLAPHRELIAYQRLEPTLYAEGCEAFWQCSACGKYFLDADGINEIIDGLAIIPKLNDDEPDPNVSFPGDLNGDSAVDGKDALRLMKYLAEEIDPETGEIFEIREDNADVNGDGVVDLLDLLRLMRYLSGEDVTLSPA